MRRAPRDQRLLAGPVARRIKWVELNRPLWGLYQRGGRRVAPSRVSPTRRAVQARGSRRHREPVGRVAGVAGPALPRAARTMAAAADAGDWRRSVDNSWLPA